MSRIPAHVLRQKRLDQYEREANDYYGTAKAAPRKCAHCQRDEDEHVFGDCPVGGKTFLAYNNGANDTTRP